jgi:hypothetical protein
MGTTPQKYLAEPRDYEDKHWLYEQYWGEEFLSQRTIAENCGVSKAVIKEQMHEFGIPRRPDGYTQGNSMSAFSGFYSSQATRSDGSDNSQFDADYDNGDDYEGDFYFEHWSGLDE